MKPEQVKPEEDREKRPMVMVPGQLMDRIVAHLMGQPYRDVAPLLRGIETHAQLVKVESEPPKNETAEA